MTNGGATAPSKDGSTNGLPFGATPVAFASIVLASFVAAFCYQLRSQGIFACQGSGYTADRYLAYCGGHGYGDYDHGALWFGLEPSAERFARDADAVFVGDSRMQIALSSAATESWFAAAGANYYLLGFGYHENYLFEQPLLNKIRPRASVFIINLDGFFDSAESKPAALVMRDTGALRRYYSKHFWQLVHRPVCAVAQSLCGTAYEIFRSRRTGAYFPVGAEAPSAAVSESPLVEHSEVSTHARRAQEFFERLPVKPPCIILTIVPTVGAKRAFATAVASASGIDLISPSVPGLRTYDGSHLDPDSADRWSRAFLEAAGPRIRSCLQSRSGGSD